MKQLNNYIYEKLKINSNSKINHFEYSPETKKELIEILKDRLSKNNNADLNDIDTSKITDMSYLFKDLYIDSDIEIGDINISDWNVSNVKNMYNMFYGANINCDLSNWDVSNVEDMREMFTWCKKFEGKGLENWNIQKITSLQSTFFGCTSFTGKSIENWNISNVTTLSWTFSNCLFFNPDLSNWNTENVIYMDRTFENCQKFEGKGLENWNIESCHSLIDCFKFNTLFNVNLSKWNISNCRYFQYMFYDCQSFEGNGLEQWANKFNSRVKASDCRSMFNKCPSLKFVPNKYWKGNRITTYMFK